MKRALILPLLLAACTAAPGGSSDSADVVLDLPEGVTRDQVYTRQPDPRAGPCYYYRVEGLEVLLNCIG